MRPSRVRVVTASLCFCLRGRQTDEALEGARRHGELVLLLLTPGLARCSWGLVHEARLEAHAHVSVPIRKSDPRLLAEHRLLTLAHAEVFPQEVDGDHFRHVIALAVLLLEDLGRLVLPTGILLTLQDARVHLHDAPDGVPDAKPRLAENLT